MWPEDKQLHGSLELKRELLQVKDKQSSPDGAETGCPPGFPVKGSSIETRWLEVQHRGQSMPVLVHYHVFTQKVDITHAEFDSRILHGCRMLTGNAIKKMHTHTKKTPTQASENAQSEERGRGKTQE